MSDVRYRWRGRLPRRGRRRRVAAVVPWSEWLYRRWVHRIQRDPQSPAFAALAAMLRPWLMAIVATYSPHPNDWDDWYQRALVALWEAACAFRPPRPTMRFLAWAGFIIRRKLRDAQRHQQRHPRWREVLLIDAPEWRDHLADPTVPRDQALAAVIDADATATLMTWIATHASPLEYRVACAVADTASGIRAAQRLGVSYRTVDNALQRLRRRWRRARSLDLPDEPE